MAILTSIRAGYASSCLPALCASPHIEVVGVVLSTETATHENRTLRRRLRKIRKIGLLGALNGLRLRKWYVHEGVEDIATVAGRHGVPLVLTEGTNSPGTKAALEEADADLGLSLGNSYIAENIFSVPRHGMINVHNEVLPRFQGAQSIIWPIYEGVSRTGFTIHQIDEHIDTGGILLRKEFDIQFQPTLRQTVETNLEIIHSQVPGALRFVCENYEHLKAQASRQKKGRLYTTASFRQFLKMYKNHRDLYQRATKNP